MIVYQVIKVLGNAKLGGSKIKTVSTKFVYFKEEDADSKATELFIANTKEHQRNSEYCHIKYTTKKLRIL